MAVGEWETELMRETVVLRVTNITGSVEGSVVIPPTVTNSLLYSVVRMTSLHAKADNPVHCADKRRIVLFKMIWIHRMPSVVDLRVLKPASANGKYSVRCLLYSVQPTSTALVKQILTQRYIYFYVEE